MEGTLKIVLCSERTEGVKAVNHKTVSGKFTFHGH